MNALALVKSDIPLMPADLSHVLRKRVRAGECVTVGQGWWPIIIRLDAVLSAIDPDYTFCELKEKFGSLRIDADSVNISDAEQARRFLDAVEAAEEESQRTCELCGQPGTVKSYGGWLKCRCSRNRCNVPSSLI